MNDQDHLDIDLESEEEVCEPTEDELDEDINPCDFCCGC